MFEELTHIRIICEKMNRSDSSGSDSSFEDLGPPSAVVTSMPVASAPTVLEPLSYRAAMRRSGEISSRPFTTSFRKDGKTVSWLVRMQFNQSVKEQLDSAMRSGAYESPAGCYCCIGRLGDLGSLMGPDGRVLLYGVRCCEPVTKSVCDIIDRAIEQKSYSNLTIQLVGESMCPSVMEGNFPHWTAKSQSFTDKVTLTKMKEGIKKYFFKKDEMLGDLLNQLLEPGVHASLLIFIEVLKKSLAFKNFNKSATWALKIIEHVKDHYNGKRWIQLSLLDQLQVAMFAICESNLDMVTPSSEDPYEEHAWDPTKMQARDAGPKKPHMTYYHQVSGFIIDAIKDAHNEKALLAMLNDRMDPLKYRRPTADPKDQSLANSAASLGDFQNEVITFNDAKRRYPARMVWEKSRNQSTSSKSILDSMIAARQAPKVTSALGGFAQRCATSPSITSLDQLIAILNDGQKHTLHVDSTSHAPCHAIKTNLHPQKLAKIDGVPMVHFWSFLDGVACTIWGGTAEMEVEGIWTMPRGGKLFVIKFPRPPRTFSPGCFPEFLAPEMHGASKTFEVLNMQMTASIPQLEKEDCLMTGLVVSKTASQTLNFTLSGKIDGKAFKLTHWD